MLRFLLFFAFKLWEDKIQPWRDVLVSQTDILVSFFQLYGMQGSAYPKALYTPLMHRTENTEQQLCPSTEVHNMGKMLRSNLNLFLERPTIGILQWTGTVIYPAEAEV